MFSGITGIKSNILLIFFFGLASTLTSVSGGCDVGNQDVKVFDVSRVGFGVLT